MPSTANYVGALESCRSDNDDDGDKVKRDSWSCEILCVLPQVVHVSSLLVKTY